MRHRPVLVSAPKFMPVSLAAAKEQLRIDGDDNDSTILRFLRTAVSHLDGWSGVLGQCLVEQQWRQDFDRFGRQLQLQLGPVINIDSIAWRDAHGVETTIVDTNYTLCVDAGGRPHVRFFNAFSSPGNLAETAAVSVTYTAGHETASEEDSTVPDDLKGAIMLHVGHLYENREAVSAGNITTLLPLGYDSLVEKLRRVGV